MQNQYMIKAEYFDRKNAYGHLEEMVSMDEAQLEDVPNNMRPKMPFTKADAMGWKNRAGSRLAHVHPPACKDMPCIQIQKQHIRY